MNTSRIKNFAPAARTQLMEAVERKLDYVLTARTPDLVGPLAGQVASLRKQSETNRKDLIERVAYTWFNRLAALRFMDANGYHPFFARVLTPANAQEIQPELLKLARTGSLPDELKPHTAPARLNDLLDRRLPTAIAGADPQGEVYHNLVLAVCRYYNAVLPLLFERLDDETELLLPDDLLTATSVAEGFRTEITDEDCAEEEILGWFYQYYISDKKDEVMGRNAAVPKEDIPAVTQLFTPHWIVRYLVENSLGRLWLLNRPQSKLREKMPYYIEDAPNPEGIASSSPGLRGTSYPGTTGTVENNPNGVAAATGHQPSTLNPQPGNGEFLRITKPEDIRLLDPAGGSGHMLTYAFDLLYAMYEEAGYNAPEIPSLILRHNLYGVDICDRAAAIAAFALRNGPQNSDSDLS